MQSKSQKAGISDASGAPGVSGRTTRKFITDLFIAGEHFSFATMDDVVQAIFESGGLISTVHECEAPSICNDVTSDVAWAVCEALDYSEPLYGWRRDYIEHHCGIMAARSFPRAAA